MSTHGTAVRRPGLKARLAAGLSDLAARVATGAGEDGYMPIGDLASMRTYDPDTGVYDCLAGKAIMFEMLPVVSIDEAAIGNLHSMLAEIDTGRGVMQVLNWSSPMIAGALDRWTAARTDFAAMTRARCDLFEAGALGEVFTQQRWRIRHTRVFCVFMIPHGGGGSGRMQTERLLAARGSLHQGFRSIGTQLRPVEPAMLIPLCRQILTPDPASVRPHDGGYNALESIHEQIRAPGAALAVNRDGLVFRDGASLRDEERAPGPVAMRCWSVAQLPRDIGPGAPAALIGEFFNTGRFCPWPVLQSLTFTRAAMSRDAVGLRANRSWKQANSWLRHFMPEVGREYHDWQQTAEALAEGETLASLHYQLVLQAPEAELASAETALHNLFEGNGFGIRIDSGIQAGALAAALPMGCGNLAVMTRLRRTRTVFQRNALALMPVFGEWRGNGWGDTPPVALFAGRRGELAGFTPWDSDGNHNLKFVGPPGVGKSVCMQELAIGAVATGGSVIVIDDGRSFRNSCLLLGGTHVDFADADLRINPFAAVDEALVRRNPDFLEEVQAMLVGFLCALAHPGTDSDDLEDSLLAAVVQSVWNEHGNAARIDHVIETLILFTAAREGETVAGMKTLNAVAARDLMSRAGNLATLLQRFSSTGAAGAHFTGGCSVTLEARLIVFEMEALRRRRHIRAAAMTLIVFLAQQKTYLTPRDHRVAIMIDEAWALLEGASGKFIEGVARRARKYNGALITATQSVADYFRNPAATAAWEQSDWTIMFAQSDSSIRALREEQQINLTPTLERALRDLHSRQGLWSEMVIHNRGGGWNIVRLPLDDLSLTAFSSKGEDVAAIETLVAGGLTRDEAILRHAAAIRKTAAPKGGADDPAA